MPRRSRGTSGDRPVQRAPAATGAHDAAAFGAARQTRRLVSRPRRRRSTSATRERTVSAAPTVDISALYSWSRPRRSGPARCAAAATLGTQPHAAIGWRLVVSLMDGQDAAHGGGTHTSGTGSGA